MNLFDRYLLREWLKMLGLLLAATMGLLTMAALYDNLRDFIQIGVGLGGVALYYATLMPSQLSVVLPLAMLLSLLFVLGKLHRNNELLSMRTAGLNIFATTRALWLAGALLCGVSLLLNAHVVPWSVETSRSLRESFEFRAESRTAPSDMIGITSSVTFDNQRQNRMWFINHYSRFSGIAHGVSVSELTSKRQEKNRIFARAASYDATKRAWTFRDGREMRFDPGQGDLQHTTTFTEKTFPQFNEDPALMLLIDRRPGELSFNELGLITRHFSSEDDPKLARYETRYYSLLFDTLGPLIIIAIAIPFAMSGVRVSPAVGVSKSIGLFFMYYLLVTLATLLGGNGVLNPVWAALIPNLAMTGLATYFFGRMR